MNGASHIEAVGTVAGEATFSWSTASLQRPPFQLFSPPPSTVVPQELTILAVETVRSETSIEVERLRSQAVIETAREETKRVEITVKAGQQHSVTLLVFSGLMVITGLVVAFLGKEILGGALIAGVLGYTAAEWKRQREMNSRVR